MVVDKIKKRESKNLNNTKSKVDIPVGKWVKCNKCKEILYKETIRENLNICPNCGNYFRMHINRRLESIIDKGTYKRFELNIETNNPLNLEDYPKKLKALREKTGLEEAIACGTGKINGEDVVICIMDSGFLMGSMGAVVGEKITYSIEQAIRLKLPIIIHTREAIQDTINILKKCKLKSGGILHCCPFNKDLVETGLEAGLYIAFGGTCTFKNSKNASEIIELVPIEKMLVETDSPYLAPEPKRGTRNDSRNLEFIINKIAEVKNIPSEEVANKTFENAIKIFQIKE